MESEVLLHMCAAADWEVARSSGALAPPSLAEIGFVHLSTPEQVELPANRLFHGRSDVLLLVLDPARIGVEVRWEPGVPGDPEAMRFPHAYGPIPTTAVLDVLPYRPGSDGSFTRPDLPAR
ncbi:DUF952 domain-containing protein [Pseudonocardia zijingensis]|jgi:uncharacterized protein (DUF952 family)|uniref:DUF952 domain-containing protein n=1 Tax=Pseudonocardia zijingensis TaxID=153376 RepID=A0ABN1Q7C0_9PSEU